MQTKKLGILSALTAALLGSFAGCSNVSVAGKPLAGSRLNILLIVADDNESAVHSSRLHSAGEQT